MKQIQTRSTVILLTGVLLAAMPALAQEPETETTIASYAAGYVAGFTCSAVFNANKERNAIAEHELTGIYPLVAEQVAHLNAEINRKQRWVSVPYNNGANERIAVWRERLQNGQWQGEQVLPNNWLEYISTPAPAQPPEGAPGYGAQWWLYNERFPELPNDTIAARGNRGQFLVIIPSNNLVIVRRGYDLAGKPGFNEHDFARDVLNAIASEYTHQ